MSSIKVSNPTDLPITVVGNCAQTVTVAPGETKEVPATLHDFCVKSFLRIEDAPAEEPAPAEKAAKSGKK